MYIQPEFDETGTKRLCEESGEMKMDIAVKRLAAGERFTVCAPGRETAVLLLAGEVTFAFGGETRTGARGSVFTEKPYCVHVCGGAAVTVTAKAASRVLVQQTANDRAFETRFYAPGDCMLQEFGRDQWDGTAHRQVLTVFDYESAPYSNMVLGEVLHKPGCWSSYPPHWHPQPEVYYYEFDRPQGFGVGFVGDQPYRVQDGGCLCVTPMRAHQQVAAPGYRMYYAWLIRHLDGDPWRKTRINDPRHEWLMK